ncbi:hypothetical protein HPP92_004797, partial [Vanilla planifolia]
EVAVAGAASSEDTWLQGSLSLLPFTSTETLTSSTFTWVTRFDEGNALEVAATFP